MTEEAAETVDLDAGTYEVLRARLAEQAGELARRAEQLNAKRIEVFGGTEMALLGSERIRTENNCVPRDIVSIGDGRMLVGYNVFIGLKNETTVDDVFEAFTFARANGTGATSGTANVLSFESLGSDVVRGGQFDREFGELFRYYRDTRLMQLRRTDSSVLAVFQTGPNATDVRVLRWSLTDSGTGDGLQYIDNRGEREHVFPPSHDFEWTETTRADHVAGRHPHISIHDDVFVETVGGNLTIKVEDNTETGEGVYSEPVDEPLQSLADANVWYARLGPLVLLKVRPYNEEDWRYLVFNTRTRDVVRLDGIGQACLQLPEDHGVIFPGGYYLTTGVARTFDAAVGDLEYLRVIKSPNGEDVMYVFYAREDGRSLLLPYNVIRKEVGTPITCHGYSLFDDGTLVVFRASSDEPTRVHPMQVWRTPFVSDVYAASQPAGTGPLERVGNADLVRGVSDALSVTAMVAEMSPSAPVFEAIISSCQRVFDHYHWLAEPDLFSLSEPLSEVKATAEQVLAEFEGVQALTAQAASAVDTAADEISSLVRRVRGEAPKSASEVVGQLADLHRAEGHLVSLREMRYVDTQRLDQLAESLEAEIGSAAGRAVAFLERDDAFASYHAEVAQLAADAQEIRTVAEAEPVEARIADQAEALAIVTDVVGALNIADATVRTSILESISEVMAGVNRARAVLTSHRRGLLESENRATFAAEFALIGHEVSSALALADTPEACDEQLGRLMLTLENLEARFGELDEFVSELEAKRTDIYEAFSARKQSLSDERARRAERLAESAGRLLDSVRRRTASLESLDEVNTYFASDPMVAKLRSLADQLGELGDNVRSEELTGRIKAARQEAGRTLRDQLDLYDGDTIRLGRSQFAVNTQPIDVTMIPGTSADGSDAMTFSVTGTDYRQPVADPSFAGTTQFWDQRLISETTDVYRSEHLAASLLAVAVGGDSEHTLDGLHEAAVSEEGLLPVVRAAAEQRYDEGYERGVHDHDASSILEALLRLRDSAGTLRYPPSERAGAQLFWAFAASAGEREAWTRRATSLARAREKFGTADGLVELAAELGDRAGVWLADLAGRHTFSTIDGSLVGEYLVEELGSAPDGFATSAEAKKFRTGFRRAVGGAKSQSLRELSADLRSLGDDVGARLQLVESWMTAYAASSNGGIDHGILDEAAAIELCGTDVVRYDVSAQLAATVEGLLGKHPRISDRKLKLRIDEVLARTHRFRVERVPEYRDYVRRRNTLISNERQRLRLDELKPDIMTGFVRNKLLDQVYLPLIGDNLAKQIGTVGDSKRTDQSGLLMLISPPGYGKTTLMEYVARRLGLVFVKVNGPALGHDVTSVDPADAPNATARQEVEKISFALEMGNNVLLYLDDIQHTSPELLQKFISLTDSQRQMEGVWGGQTRTYDLRGKRFAVCMAGNPYTESGQRFRVPDMLANRADVWNLGDVLSGRDKEFALSYVENALTSNAVLSPVSTRDQADVELLVRLARSDESARSDQLHHPYSATELDEILAVMRKLLRVQEVVLTVNQAYIASAAQADSSRTEPPFQLQGSYRNMNRLVERIVPVMNDNELEAVIDDHYAGEAQTLTSGAEANVLKLAELRGRLTDEQAARWEDVKASFRKAQALGGGDDDPISRTVGAVGHLADQVGAVEAAIRNARQ